MYSRPEKNHITVVGAAGRAALFSALAFPLLFGTPALTPAAAQEKGPDAGKGGRRVPNIATWNQKEFKERLERLPEKERLGVQLVQRMVTAQISVPIIAREIFFSGRGGEVEHWVRWDPQQGMRRESIRPTPGVILLDNWKKQYLYDPRERRWTESDTMLPRPQGRIGDVLRRLYSGELKATLDGQDTIAGRAADIVRVEPKKGGRGPSRRFWVDKATGIRLRSEEMGREGRLFSSSYYVSLDLNPKFRDDDFTPPAHAVPMRKQKRSFRSVDEAHRAGLTFRQPSYIPSGFKLEVIDVYGDERDPKFIALRYRNGITVISLNQSRADKSPRWMLEGVEKNPRKGVFRELPRGGDRAYLWRDNDTAFALIGNLNDDETRKIAVSVR
jgi:outer membrane lipoprotein-sorting protein